ncbi:hypothetical protein BH10BAC5_BH10BAC5_16770 [soil metagenome]
MNNSNYQNFRSNYLKNLQSITTTLSDGVIITDVEEKIVWVNPSFEKICGYTLKNLEGKNPRILQGTDTDPQNVKLIRNSINSITPVTTQLLNYKRDLTPYWINLNIVPLRNDNNEVVYFIAFGKDVTHEINNIGKLSLKDLDEKKQFLKEIGEGIPGAIFQSVFYPDGSSELIYASKSYLELWGAATDSVFDNTKRFDWVHSDDKELFFSNLEILKNSEAKRSYKYRYINKNTLKITWVNIVASSRRIDNNKMLVTGIIIDITENEAYYKRIEEANQISEFISKATHESIWELDLATEKIYLSGAYKEITGFEFPGNVTTYSKWRELVHTDDRQYARTSLQTTLADKSKRSWEIEYRVVRKDGEYRDTYSRAYIIYDEKDNIPVKIIGSTRDITDQKKYEASLSKSNKELSDYKLALDQSSIVSMTDHKGIINYVNDTFLKISKYSAEELIGHDHRIINSGYHPKEYIRDLWKTIGKGKIWKGEFRNKAKDGSFYWVDATIVPFLNEKGKPYKYVAIRNEITDQKKYEQDLQNSEKKFRAFFESAPESIFIFDIEKMKFSDCNSNAEKLLKYKREEILNMSLLELSPENQDDGTSSIDRLLFLIDKTLKEDSVISDWIIRNSEGEKIFTEIRPSLLSEQDKNLIRISVIDISERKRADEFKSEVTNDLLKKNLALEEFTYIISHYLRAPVANILSLSEIIEEKSLSEIEKEKIFLLNKRSAYSLDEIIRDLNDILNLKKEIIEENSEISFENIVNGIIHTEESLIAETGMKIIYNFKPAPFIYSLRTSLYSIFHILINNSIKFRSSNEPALKIYSDEDKENIYVTFDDNGLGINLARHGNHVFLMYKKFHPHKSGKGMGLFIVKNLVQSLGGDVRVESEIGEGSKFILNFKKQQ